jgi:DDE family transposase
MSIQGVFLETFTFLGSKPVVVEVSSSQLSSDAGLLPIRQLDEALGLTESFAHALEDLRCGPTLTHSYLEMTRSRVYGVLAGYADQNDHDTLRSDGIFKLVAGRSPDGADLASQPTLSRFENAIDPGSLLRLRDVFMDQFMASFDAPPTRLTFDIDPFDDPTHGQQQLPFFHGFYDQDQYLPRVITCADNDLTVMVALLFGTAAASLGADDDMAYLVGRLRAVWPDVHIEIRADSGFAVPGFYEACETLGIQYSIGLAMNAALKRRSEALLKKAVARFEATGEAQRLFDGFFYQAKSWSTPRWVVVKAEAHSGGTNRRAVVTNRPGARVLPGPTYDAYADRGEAENRNKELKCGLNADRLSDHRFMANYFRLYLHALAANLLVRVRREVADPPTPSPAPPDDLPTEALAESNRKRFFNRRRRHDPLGEGHADTWRTRLIKVAAEIVVSARRVWIRLSNSWPFLDHFRAVCQAVAGLKARGDPDTS